MFNKVTSFKHACKILALDPTLPAMDANNPFAASTLAHYQLMVIIQAVNGKDKKHDWGNDDPKHFVWANMGGTNGSEFSLDYVFYYFADSGVSSRLCFFEREAAEYTFNKFKKLYKAYFLVA